MQIPQQQRADGECAELALRAHQSFNTVRAPFLPTVFARAADVGRIGRLCSERRGMVGGCMSGGIEPGRCGSRAVAVLSEGTVARDVTREYSRGIPSHGYSARVPEGQIVAVGAA